MSELKSLLEPVSRLVVSLDLSDSNAAEAQLDAAFPPGSEAVQEIERHARAGVADGTICHRGDDSALRFSRIVKPEADVANCSIDAVYMRDGKGPVHTHLEGEVCLCLPDDATAAFFTIGASLSGNCRRDRRRDEPGDPRVRRSGFSFAGVIRLNSPLSFPDLAPDPKAYFACVA